MRRNRYHLGKRNVARLTAVQSDPRMIGSTAVRVMVFALAEWVRHVRSELEDRIKARKTGRLSAVAAE